MCMRYACREIEGTPEPALHIRKHYIFVNVQDDIMKFGKNEDCILLVGDMNGRSARIQDFIDTSGNKHIDDILQF